MLFLINFQHVNAYPISSWFPASLPQWCQADMPNELRLN